MSGCVCEWLSKAKKQAPVESYTEEKVPYLHSQKERKYKKCKSEKELQKECVIVAIQKSYQSF